MVTCSGFSPFPARSRVATTVCLCPPDGPGAGAMPPTAPTTGAGAGAESGAGAGPDTASGAGAGADDGPAPGAAAGAPGPATAMPGFVGWRTVSRQIFVGPGALSDAPDDVSISSSSALSAGQM